MLQQSCSNCGRRCSCAAALLQRCCSRAAATVEGAAAVLQLRCAAAAAEQQQVEAGARALGSWDYLFVELLPEFGAVCELLLGLFGLLLLLDGLDSSFFAVFLGLGVCSSAKALTLQNLQKKANFAKKSEKNCRNSCRITKVRTPVTDTARARRRQVYVHPNLHTPTRRLRRQVLRNAVTAGSNYIIRSVFLCVFSRKSNSVSGKVFFVFVFRKTDAKAEGSGREDGAVVPPPAAAIRAIFGFRGSFGLFLIPK